MKGNRAAVMGPNELTRLQQELEEVKRENERLRQQNNEYQDLFTVLSREEYLRYGRQMILPQVGRSGQERLKKGRVLVVGAGGLGSPVLIYLATAGVGMYSLSFIYWFLKLVVWASPITENFYAW